MVDQYWFPEVDRFQKSIAKALTRRGLGDKIGVVVDVLKGVDFAPVLGGSPTENDEQGYTPGVDL